MEASEVFKDVKPFTGLPTVQNDCDSPTILADAMVQREIAEVQGAITVAKKFPRHEAKCIDKILTACQRPSLAEKGLYNFSRGGTEISGASVHLLKSIAQYWGNIDFGLRELEQRLGESTVQAFAWDLETNTRETRTFQVGHIRYKRSGTTKLTDPRDIYEMVANLGARRMRACLEGVIPSDVVELAKEQCEATILAKADNSPEAVKRMADKFAEIGVTRPMIEARIQRRLESITPAQIISLRKVYNSLKDGMSTPADWFNENHLVNPEAAKAERKPRSDKGSTRKSQESSPPETLTQGPESGEVALNGSTIGPRPVSDKLLDLIRENIKRTQYEEMILLQDYEITSLSELSETAGENMLKFLITLPDVD